MIVRFLVLLPWTTPVALSAIAWLWDAGLDLQPHRLMLRQVGLIDGNMYWLGRPNLALLSSSRSMRGGSSCWLPSS